MVKKECSGNLIAVGGGESNDATGDSLKILERFVELSGGANDARIVLMTVPTDEPEVAEERYKKIFDRLKVKNFDAVNIADRSESFDDAILKKIEKATGLYFTGGNQLHVTTLTGGTPLHELINGKFQKGSITIGGTSAGAMVMSSSTILSGASDCAPRLNSIEVVPGMNLLENSIIDTHFSQRGRHGRLLSAVAHNPQILGIGIDERTALVIKNGKFEVIGEGAVTVIDVGASKHTNLPYINSEQTIGMCGVNFHVLPEGYKYDLKTRQPISPTFKKMMAAKNEE